MLDISITEVGLIFVVALLVFGPERLPKVARTVGRFLGRARRFWDKMKRDAEDSYQDPH